MRTFLTTTASLSAILLTSAAASAATITVGPNGTHPAPCAAIAAAAPGDVIEIDSTGTYEKDYCIIDKNDITLRGTGAGRAKIDAKLELVEMLPAGDAIWFVDADNVTIEKVELMGAKSAVTKKGAAIRQSGKGLTVIDCSFHDNDSGIIIEDDPAAEVSISASEFGHNGISGGEDDPGHISVGRIAKLTLKGSYLHHGLKASMVMSNAAENHIFYNRITSETDGSSWFSLDLPLGGLTYVVGNMFHRSAADLDNKMIHYRYGQGTLNPSDELYVVNNTFVSDEPALAVDASIDVQMNTMPVVRNNIFDIPGMGGVTKPAEALEASNLRGDAGLVDKTKFDYRLQEASPAVDKGVDPGMGGTQALTPDSQYMHVAQTENRPVDDPIDLGAFEFPPPVSPAGGGGAGGTGAGGEGQGGSGEGGATASSAAATGSGTGGARPGDEDTGCGCRTGDAGSPNGAAFVALGIGLLYGVRRRRAGAASRK